MYVFLSHTNMIKMKLNDLPSQDKNSGKLTTMDQPVGGDIHLSYNFGLTATNFIYVTALFILW